MMKEKQNDVRSQKPSTLAKALSTIKREFWDMEPGMDRAPSLGRFDPVRYRTTVYTKRADALSDLLGAPHKGKGTLHNLSDQITDINQKTKNENSAYFGEAREGGRRIEIPETMAIGDASKFKRDVDELLLGKQLEGGARESGGLKDKIERLEVTLATLNVILTQLGKIEKEAKGHMGVGVSDAAVVKESKDCAAGLVTVRGKLRTEKRKDRKGKLEATRKELEHRLAVANAKLMKFSESEQMFYDDVNDVSKLIGISALGTELSAIKRKIEASESFMGHFVVRGNRFTGIENSALLLLFLKTGGSLQKMGVQALSKIFELDLEGTLQELRNSKSRMDVNYQKQLTRSAERTLSEAAGHMGKVSRMLADADRACDELFEVVKALVDGGWIAKRLGDADWLEAETLQRGTGTAGTRGMKNQKTGADGNTENPAYLKLREIAPGIIRDVEIEKKPVAHVEGLISVVREDIDALGGAIHLNETLGRRAGGG